MKDEQEQTGAAVKGPAALDADAGGGRAASEAGGGIPPLAAGLLNIVEAIRWGGRSYLVKVGLDPDGIARAVAVQMIGPRHIGTDMDHAGIALAAALGIGKTVPELAVEWPDEDRAIGRLVAVVNRIEAASGDIIRRAFR